MKQPIHNNMTGGLFDGKPLEVVHDPSRDIRAQQIATSLRSLVTGRCAIPEEVWQGVWERTGKPGELTDDWRTAITKGATFAQSIAQSYTVKDSLGNEKAASGKEKASVFEKGLLDLARSLLA